MDQQPETQAVNSLDQEFVRLYVEYHTLLFSAFDPSDRALTVLVRIFATEYAEEADDERSNLTFDERLSALEDRWWRFTETEITKRFFRLFPLSQTEGAGTKHDRLYESAGFLLALERAVFHALGRQNEKLFLGLLCRRPLLFAPIRSFLNDEFTQPVFPREYVELLGRRFKQLLRGKITEKELARNFTSFLLAVKSPFLDSLNSLEYVESLVQERLKESRKSIFDLLRDDVILKYRLRPEQHAQLEAEGRNAFPPPISEDSILALIIIQTRNLSEAFFEGLPGVIVDWLKCFAPEVFNNCSDQETPNIFAAIGLVNFEFPELQLEKILRKEIGRLRFLEQSTKDPRKQRRIVEESAEKLFALRRKYEESFYEIQADYERCRRRLSGIAAPEKEKILRAGQAFEAAKERYEKLAADVAALQKEMARDEIMRRVFDFLVRDIAHWQASAENSMTMYAVNDSIAELREELPTILGNIAAPEEDEESRNKLVRGFLQVLSSALSWKRSDFVDPLSNLGSADAISGARFDLPDPQGARVRESVARIDLLDRRRVMPMGRSKKRLAQVAEIVKGLDAGFPADTLRHVFPAHLVEAVSFRLELRLGKTDEELKALHRKNRLLLALVEQKHAVDCFIETHCQNLERLHRGVLDGLKKKWKIKHAPLDCACSLLALDACWEWYVGGAENVYADSSRTMKQVKNVEQRKAAFRAWLQRALCVGLMDYRPQLHRLLVLRRPCLFAAGLSDFNVEEIPERGQYLEMVVDAFVEFAAGCRGDELVRLWETFFALLRNPYRDAYRRNLYDLNGFVDRLFLLEDEQRDLFSAEMRRSMLANWVEENEVVFWGDKELGRFPTLFLGTLQERNKLLHDELLDATADREVRFLQTLVRPADTTQDSDEEPVLRALSPIAGSLKRAEILRDLFRKTR